MVEINRAGAAQLGVDEKRLTGQLLQQFVAAESQAAFREHLQSVLTTRATQRIALAMVRNDGTPFFAHLTSLHLPYADDGAPSIRMMVEDTTRLVQAEQALRHSEERYRALVQNLPDVLWSMDSSYHFTYVGPRAEELTGFSSAELTGAPLDAWLRQIHPDDQDWVSLELRALL